LVLGSDEGEAEGERIQGAVRTEVDDLVEEVEDGAVRQDHHLSPDDLVVDTGVEDLTRRLPAGAAVGRAREQARAAEVELTQDLEPIPNSVHEVGIGGIGGHRFLVVEDPGVRVVDDEGRIAPV
jgi:hypothetical protein